MTTKGDGKGIEFGFRVGFGDTATAVADSNEEEHDTFRLMLVSELAPRDAFAAKPPRPRRAIRVAKKTFDEALAVFTLELSLEVPDPVIEGGKPLEVKMRWKTLRDLRPQAWKDDVAPLRALFEARALIAANEGRIDTLRTKLAESLPRAAWAEAFLAGGGDAPRAAAPQTTTSAPRPVSKQPASGGPLDSILSQIDVGEPEAAPQAKASSALGGFISAVALGTKAGDAPRGAGPRVDRAIATLLDSLLGHPEVRRLERGVRGLSWLCDRIGAKSGVLLDVIAAPMDDVSEAIETAAESTAADGPIDLIVVDHEIGATPRDIERLAAWSERGEALLAPVVACVSPALLGVDGFPSLASSRRDVARSEDPRAILLRTAAARESSRWMCLALNGPFARAAYETSSLRLGELGYAEDATRSLSLGASIAVAALTARSFERFGWACALTAAPDVLLEDLIVAPSGEKLASPLTIPADAQMAREAGRAGVILLVGKAGTDKAIAATAPVLHRGAIGPSGVSAPASTSLGDQLFVARLARTITQLAHELPSDGSPAVLEVARIALSSPFASTPGQCPTFAITARDGVLDVTVKPRGFLGVSLAEVSLSAALGG